MSRQIRCCAGQSSCRDIPLAPSAPVFVGEEQSEADELLRKRCQGRSDAALALVCNILQLDVNEGSVSSGGCGSWFCGGGSLSSEIVWFCVGCRFLQVIFIHLRQANWSAVMAVGILWI